MDLLDAVVVVPAHDEAARIAGCIEALAAQTAAGRAFELVVVLDACTDATGEVATCAAARHGIALTLTAGPGRGSGPARRAGMDLACERLLAAGRPEGLIATTDADSRPAPDWLERQLAHRDAGAQVIAGRIELDAEEAARLPPEVLRARERDAAARLRAVRRRDPDAAHHHFAGASIALTAATYRAVGGLEPTRALEDDVFGRRLAGRGVPILRAPDVTVFTSARVDGRATRGLALDLAVAAWSARRRLRATDYTWAALAALPRPSATVIVPVKECAGTIGGVLDVAVAPALAHGLIDEVVVVDAASADGSAQIAAARGARVLQQDELVAELGPAEGKGDAMWRALQATRGEIVCFMDGDTADPSPDHLLGLLGPLLSDPSIALVKGTFERPFQAQGSSRPNEGGRVTELMARPLLNLHVPELAGFSQPLAGEFAARRDLLEAIPFPCGYGVEIGTLVDALRLRGLDALAECDLGTRQNRHQPLRALGEMSYAVLAALEQRLPDGPRSPAGGRYLRPWSGEPARVPVDERPPVREWVEHSLGATPLAVPD